MRIRLPSQIPVALYMNQNVNVTCAGKSQLAERLQELLERNLSSAGFMVGFDSAYLVTRLVEKTDPPRTRAIFIKYGKSTDADVIIVYDDEAVGALHDLGVSPRY